MPDTLETTPASRVPDPTPLPPTAPPAPPVPPTPPTPPAPPVAPSAPAPKPEEPATSSLGSGLRMSFVSDDGSGGAADVRSRAIVMAIVLGVEAVLIGIGFFALTRVVAAREARRDAIVADIAALDAQAQQQSGAILDAAAFRRQVNATKEALDKHYTWTSFFAYLEAHTRPTVTYHSFTGDADSGTFSVDAVGTSYRDVAEQLVALRELPEVAAVRTAGASAKIDERGAVVGVSFSMVITLKPNVWNGGIAAAQDAQPEAAAPGIVQCSGDDAAMRACFDAGMRTCVPTVMVTSGGAGAPSDTYEVVGPGPAGCLVRRTVSDQSNPQLNGATMTCPMNAERTLAENLVVLASADWIGCTGSLVPLLVGTTPPPAAAPAEGAPEAPASALPESAPAATAPAEAPVTP